MKNSNVTLVVSFDGNDIDSVAKYAETMASFNRSEWSRDRISRSITDMVRNSEKDIYVSLDYVFSMNHEGEHSENYKVITLDELEQAINDTWGELFNEYNVIGTGAGDYYPRVVEKAQALAIETGKNSIFDFNGLTVIVGTETNLDHLDRDRENASYLGVDTIGPDCVEAYDKATIEKIEEIKAEKKRKWDEYCAEEARKDALKKQSIMDRIKNVEMAVTNPTLWKEYKEKNTDDYGGRCVSYAEEWARLMQVELAKITKGFQWTETAYISAFNHVAEKTSREADYDGITGFMYGCAVNMLVQCWEKGEMLRKWHNKEYGHEGSGVVNPAVMTVAVG